MENFRVAPAGVLVFSAFTLPGQVTATAKASVPPASTEPPIADVHPSPYRPATYYGTNISEFGGSTCTMRRYWI